MLQAPDHTALETCVWRITGSTKSVVARVEDPNLSTNNTGFLMVQYYAGSRHAVREADHGPSSDTRPR